MAKTSSPFEIFFAKTCVIVIVMPTNIARYSIANTPILLVITKNQNDIPAVTANDLNLGEDVCILNRINECYKSRLGQCSYSH